MGTYILEINNKFGMAVVNRPIYVGPGFPLIPDFRDLVPMSFTANSKNDFRSLYEKYY